MDIDVKPCASTEDLRDALNVISHYFGHENTDEDAERFANWIEVDRMHAARADGKIVGGAGAFTYRMSVPGGGSVSAGGVTVVGVRGQRRGRGVSHSVSGAVLVSFVWAHHLQHAGFVPLEPNRPSGRREHGVTRPGSGPPRAREWSPHGRGCPLT